MVVPNSAYAAKSATEDLVPWEYSVRDPLEDEVLIKVKYCGICHSDISVVKSEWSPANYPVVPGHEFVGIVVKVGAKCQLHRVGDAVGVGCVVNSCRDCEECTNNDENLCTKSVHTYNSNNRGEPTYGGYGKYVVVREEYVCHIPSTLSLDRVAPLFCAGITVYSPIMANKINRGGLKVGVIGIGGLGHMAVQFAAAFGNDVYAISRSSKKAELIKELGAKGLVLSNDSEQMKSHLRSFNYLIDTVSAEKPMDQYLALLRPHGVLITVGAPPTGVKLSIPPLSLVLGNKSVMGSVTGGIKETQEMLEFCAEKKILPMVEKVPCSYVNEAYQRVMKSDVNFRFVLDVEATVPEVPNAPF